MVGIYPQANGFLIGKVEDLSSTAYSNGTPSDLRYSNVPS